MRCRSRERRHRWPRDDVSLGPLACGRKESKHSLCPIASRLDVLDASLRERIVDIVASVADTEDLVLARPAINDGVPCDQRFRSAEDGDQVIARAVAVLQINP